MMKVDFEFIDQRTIDDYDDLQMEGEPDILIQLIDSFLETSKQRMHAIEHFMHSEQLTKVKKEAHTLKSSAYSVGAVKLGDLCQVMSDENDASNSKEIESAFSQAWGVYNKSCKELMTIRAFKQKTMPPFSQL